MKQHYPQKQIWIDKLTTYLIQPSASALISAAANLENRTSNFIFNFASGLLSQTAVKCIQYGVIRYVGVGKVSEAVNFIFFLHHFAMVFTSENPAEAAIGQAIFSLASISYPDVF